MLTKGRGLAATVVAGLLIILWLRASPVAVASPSPPDPVGTTTSPSQSLADGCQRNPPGLFSRNSPEWTYIYNTPSNQAPPPPQWVTGTVSSFNPSFAAVHVAGGDLPMGHSAYDYNVNLVPNPQFQFLLAGDATKKTGNYAGNGEETNRLHTEWEDLSVPKFAWAEPGDTLTEKGSWVWDCGHWGTASEIFPPGPDYIVPNGGQRCLIPQLDPQQCGAISGEAAEFHPYRALWDVRKQSNSPYAENQAELFVSTDKTLAGREADCAHDNRPPNFSLPTATADAPNFTTYYLTYPSGYNSCLTTTGNNWQDVSGSYSFFLPAPPKPSNAGSLVYRVANHGSTSNAPAPTMTREGDGVRVTFNLSTDPVAKQTLMMGYTVYIGWQFIPSPNVPTHLRVSLDKLEIHRAMDAPDCRTTNIQCSSQSTRQNQSGLPPGEWNLYWDLSGNWGQWGRGEADPPAQGELKVNDGDVLQGNQVVDVYVPPGQGWRLFMHGRECDLGALGVLAGRVGDLADCPSNTEIADNNDVPGMILDSYSSAGASLNNCVPGLPGCSHRSNALTAKDDPTSTCPDPPKNPEGCFSLTYSVSVVDDAASRTLNPFGPHEVRPPAPLVGLPNTATGRLAVGAIGVVAMIGGGGAVGVALVRRRRRIRTRP